MLDVRCNALVISIAGNNIILQYGCLGLSVKTIINYR